MKLKFTLLLFILFQLAKGQTLNADFTFTVSCNGAVCFTNLSTSSPSAIAAYLWDFGDAGIFSTSPNPCYSYPFPGTYSVKLKIIDFNGGKDSVAKQVTVTGSLSSICTPSNATCNGNCDGFANIGVLGGTPPYTYSSQPAVITTAQPTNLCSGNYTITVTDANGCITTNVMSIFNTGQTSIPNTSITTTAYHETCYLSGDGAIDLEITGTNTGPFTYHWNNGSSSEDLNNLTSGIYSVYIEDGNSHCMTIQDTIESIGANCGTISGNVYIDNNSDCIKNSGDNSYGYAPILVTPGNRNGYTDLQGNYNINDLPYGTYSVSINTTNTNISPSCTTTISTTINGTNPNSSNNDFSLILNSTTQPDMNVNIYSPGIVPGFTGHVYYTLTNFNNASGSGILKAILPNAFIPTIINVSPATYTVSGDTVLWNFNSIYYYSTTIFSIDFVTPLSIPLGSVFTSCAYAKTTVTDLNPANNDFCYQRTVTGSFDPNDKAVSPVGMGVNGNISANETELTYLIRFQNTGNGPAVNIVVKDTLSPNVNINTFEMISSSHSYNIDILSGNILRWKFNNIMLPDSNSNEPSSHGYIQYKIKRTSNNTPGIQIKNTAYIYFDFNDPVITNTTINTIELVTGIKTSLLSDSELAIYPNPTTSVLYITDKQNKFQNSTIEIKNIMGQIVFTSTFTSQVDLSTLSAGVYFFNIKNDFINKSVKIIKQ